MDANVPNIATQLAIEIRPESRDAVRDLLTIKEAPIPHRDVALDWRRSKHGRPDFGGVYVLWWTGTAESLFGVIQNRSLHFLGPHGVPLAWELTHQRLQTAENGFVALYVGKNAQNLGKRFGLHLKLKTRRTIPAAAPPPTDP